ncbi:MAG: hypothetical protein ABIG71_04200, partial [Candidatus Uhrbacteria bacterium]
LTLTYSLSGGFDSSFLAAPSPFIAEIPSRMIEAIGVSRVSPRMRWNDEGRFDRQSDEPMVVLDSLGERKVEEPKRKGFLRDVDEL